MTSRHGKLPKARARKPTTFTVSMSGHCAAGRFSCSNCGLTDDADVNRAWNIAKRARGLLAYDAGSSFIIPRTLAECEPSRRLE